MATNRIDQLTGIDIDAAIDNNDNAALTRVEIAQLEAMVPTDANDQHYIEESLRSARRRLRRYTSK